MTKKLIQKLAIEPRKLFFLDAMGAFVSLVFLLLMAEFFHDWIGMPRFILFSLSAVATCLFTYSLVCFLILKKNQRAHIKLICFANSGYCLLTFGLVVNFFNLLTAIGILYFSFEIIVIYILVQTEWSVLRLISKAH